MSACETCRNDAYARARMLGGTQVEHYRVLLAERDGGDCPSRGDTMSDSTTPPVSANDCRPCRERGHECSPGAQPPVVLCPGEECASCDYAA